MGARLSPGWRVAGGLGALAFGVFLVVLVLVAVTPNEPDVDTAGVIHPSVIRPWAACVRAAREQLGGRREVAIAGPIEARWDNSGNSVDVTGTATGGERQAMPFGCRVSRVDADWHVDRLVVARP